MHLFLLDFDQTKTHNRCSGIYTQNDFLHPAKVKKGLNLFIYI